MEELTSEGQILFSAYWRVDGGRLSTLLRKKIRLDLIAPEDETILAQQGLTALRQARILRLSSRAVEQGAVLTYDDLVHLLSTSLSTVRRDVRALQRGGFSVPVYRRRGRRAGVLVLLILVPLLLSSEARAQLSSVFGDVGSDYNYESQHSESASTSQQRFLQQYNLGVDGRIIHPRLAIFSLSSAFSSSFLSEENTRASAFSGTLSLLQGAPYGLTLRAGKSFASGGADTEGTTMGANLRIALRDWPHFFVDFDRVTLEAQGDSPSDNSITTGKLRLSHRVWSSVVDAELGVQRFTDSLKDDSQDRYFARLNSTTNWSPITTLRSVSDAFLQGNQLLSSSSYSLENRPDATLSRSASFGYRSEKTGDEQRHSLNLSGAISKSFTPYPWLQANTFTSGIAQKTLGEENQSGVAWSGGSSATILYFRPVALLTDYALAVSSQTDIGQPTTIQQAHVGAISQTLDRLRLSGDYYFGFQTGENRSLRQFLVGRADLAVTPQLSLRSSADFLTENIRSSDSDGLSTERKVATVGAGATYRPLFNLNLDLTGQLQWNESPDTSGTNMRGNLHVSYFLPLPGTPTLDLNGTWEHATVTDENRIEFRSQLSYRLGQVNFRLEHRVERKEAQGQSGLNNSVHFSVVRPFRFSFN